MRVTLTYLLYTRELPFKGTGVCPGCISCLPLVTVVAGIYKSSTLWKWNKFPALRSSLISWVSTLALKPDLVRGRREGV